MKRLVALALVGSFPVVSLAQGPVSVYPPAAPGSLNQPLSSAVQSAASTLPSTPAPTMTSSPSWGSPAVLPGTTIAAPIEAVPCGDGVACQPVRPYFNLLAPRGGCERTRGNCLDRIKEWLNFRSTPGGFPCAPTPYHAPLRTYFPYKPEAAMGGCATGGCATGGCATGGCAPTRWGSSGANCGTTTVPLNRLSGDCQTGSCRPRVLFVPLTARAEVPQIGCDARPVRPRLFQRLMSFFTPKWGETCGDVTSIPTYPGVHVADPLHHAPPPAPAPMMAPPTTAPVPMTAPMPAPMPATGVPTYLPSGKLSSKAMPLSPLQPFTTP